MVNIIDNPVIYFIDNRMFQHSAKHLAKIIILKIINYQNKSIKNRTEHATCNDTCVFHLRFKQPQKLT